MADNSEYSSLSPGDEFSDIHSSSHLLSGKSTLKSSDFRAEVGRKRWIIGLCVFEMAQIFVFGLAFGLQKRAEECPRPEPDVNGCKSRQTHPRTCLIVNGI